MRKINKKIRFNGEPINIIFNIESSQYDVGFYTNSEYDNQQEIQQNEVKTITGLGISRLNELKKYTNSSELYKKYKLSVNNSDGLVLSETDNTKFTYIIDNIKYVDDLVNQITIFEYKTPIFFNDLNNSILVKEDKYLNFVNKKTESKLDIVRQSLNIFESHIRLTDIRNLEELTLYGGGYYNIIRNS